MASDPSVGIDAGWAETAAPRVPETQGRHAPTSAQRATARPSPPRGPRPQSRAAAPSATREAPASGVGDSLTALARQAGRGDPAALNALVAALAPPVRRLMHARLSGHPDDVLDDCTQEALARIADGARAARAPSAEGVMRGDAGGLAVESPVLAWALTVARHAALNYLRSPASGTLLRARGIPLVERGDAAGRRSVGGTRWGAPRGAAPTRPPAGGVDNGFDARHQTRGRPRGRSAHADPPADPGDDATASGAVDTGPVIPKTVLGGAWNGLWDAVAEPDELSPARRTVCEIAVAAQGALPPHGAELVWARVIAGASWEDLARQFGTSAGAAKRRFQRAQRVLRRACLQAIDALPAPERAAARAHLRLAAPAG